MFANDSRRRVFALAVGLAAIAVAVIVAPIADADQIAYSCGRDICLIDPDHPEDHKNLTESSTANDQAPSWSPDGNLIAMVGDYLGSYDIFTIDPTKTGAEQEATAISETADRAAEVYPPAWSSDGTRIAFAERFSSNAPPNLESEVYVAPRDGTSDPIPIDSTSNKSELTPAWSPDGASLVFSREGFLWKGPPDNSTKPTIVTNSYGYEPAWSPDGSRIATVTFSDPEHIRVTRADGSDFKELPIATDLGTTVDWSPDSSQIVYVGDEEPKDNVRVAPADGSGPGHIIPMPDGWIVPHNPTFSPDGTRVAFDARPPTSPAYEQVLVAPADGSAAAVPVTESAQHNEEPDWKPCEGCAPPAQPQSPGVIGGQPTITQAPTAKSPTKVRTVAFKKVYIYPRMAVSIDCFAKGGHPDPKYCNGDGFARVTTYTGGGFRPRARSKVKKTIVFARGSVKVPGNESRPMKFKATAAGKKLAKPGRILKVQLVVNVSRDKEKPETFKKTVKVKVPKGK
jgi:Tol biopolymer transport system component